MISPHLRFEGFDARSWTNLLSLFAPGLRDRVNEEAADTDVPETDVGEANAEPNAGTLVIIRADDGRVLKAFHTTRGRVRDLRYDGPQDLERVAKAYHSLRALELREGVLDELAESMALRLERSDDYATQWLVVARIVRELTEAGKIHSWPHPVADVPVPTAGMVRRALDVVLPDEHALVVVLWEGGAPWTAFALRRRDGVIDLAAGPDMILRWTGPLGGDWRRDHRIVASAVSRAVAPACTSASSPRRTPSASCCARRTLALGRARSPCATSSSTRRRPTSPWRSAPMPREPSRAPPPAGSAASTRSSRSRRWRPTCAVASPRSAPSPPCSASIRYAPWPTRSPVARCATNPSSHRNEPK